ncbi:DNA-directed DNA polymerase [Methanolapillus millepedarum]
MNFQILDADYKLIGEDEPVIRLFGRDEDGKSVCCLIPGFEPFFYIKSSAADQNETIKLLLETFSQIVRVEPVEKYGPVGYQTQKSPYLKIIVKAPKNVPEIRDDVLKLPNVVSLYESDILFRNRFLVDLDLGGFQWVFAEEDTSLDREHLTTEIPVKADTIICTKKVTLLDRISNASLRYLSFDIECLPDHGSMPTPDKSPVILASFAFEPAWNGKKTLVLAGKPKPSSATWLPEWDEAPESEHEIVWLKDENELFEKIFSTINDYDPDFITGYNISDFDIPYLLQRADVLKKKNARIRTGIARDGSSIYSRKFGLTVKTEVTGRIVADALPLVRRNFSLKQYTLRNAAKELLGREKLDVAPSEMEEHWYDNGQKLHKFIDYSRRDSELALELLLDLKILDKYVALARITNSVIQEILDGGQTSMVEQVMLKEYGKRDRVMPIKPDDEVYEERDSEDEGLKGGAVLDPVRGLHENVIILDYKSLYPTIMMAHNLCYTTVVDEGTDLKSLGLTDDDLDRTPSGGIFVKSRVLKGVVPSILEDLLNRRVETKRKMKQTKDEHEILALDATQMALKILLNSYYGYSGYSRARLYSMSLANSVTSIGRENILNTEKIITEDIGKIYLFENKAWLFNEIQTEFKSRGLSTESDFETGTLSDLDKSVISGSVLIVILSVVYGDTDSVFMHCAPESGGEFSDEIFSLDDAALVGSKAASIVTASLPAPMELEFEAVARRAVLIAKKRYAQWLFERSGTGWTDKIKVKGMETVRRDWCELTSDTMNRVLELVLMEGNVDEAIKYVRSVTSGLRSINLKENPDFINKLILTKNYSKKTDNYKNKQPHLTVVEKIKKRTGVSTPIGTRVPFVITSGKGLFVERAEDPEYVLKNNVPLDVDYYIKKQILPPVERILEVFGVDAGSLDKYMQKGLFDFGAPDEPEVKAKKDPIVSTQSKSSDFTIEGFKASPSKPKSGFSDLYMNMDAGPEKSPMVKEEAADDFVPFDSGVFEEKPKDNSKIEPDFQNETDSHIELETEPEPENNKIDNTEIPIADEVFPKPIEQTLPKNEEGNEKKTETRTTKKPQKSLFDF